MIGFVGVDHRSIQFRVICVVDESRGIGSSVVIAAI